jgi:hypothetical protein
VTSSLIERRNAPPNIIVLRLSIPSAARRSGRCRSSRRSHGAEIEFVAVFDPSFGEKFVLWSLPIWQVIAWPESDAQDRSRISV